MDRQELQLRTKSFHIDVLRLCQDFPKTTTGFEVARQIIRSAGSVGANCRASARAKSKEDFIYKIQIVIEEADESHYWMEIIGEIVKPGEETKRLIQEAFELTAIFTAISKTAKSNRKNN
jgi:four helix bundle protein